jgi:hypothetical protein
LNINHRIGFIRAPSPPGAVGSGSDTGSVSAFAGSRMPIVSLAKFDYQKFDF